MENAAILLVIIANNVGRIINPTAVFCSNRNDYYNNLSLADRGTDKGILAWSEYVLKGLKEEMEKIDKLTDYEFYEKKYCFLQ